MKIDISGLDKARLLQVLYNASRPLGLGFFTGCSPMTLEQAKEEIKSSANLYFDYVNGRVIKMNLSGDTTDSYCYDRDNGPGVAAKVVALLRSDPTANIVNNPVPRNKLEQLAASGEVDKALEEAQTQIRMTTFEF